MKKQGLIVLGLPPMNFFGKHIIGKRTRILELLKDEYDFHFLSYISKKKIEKILDMNVVDNIIEFSDYMKIDNWPDSYKRIDEIIEQYKFDKVFFYYSQPTMTAVAGKERQVIKSYFDSKEKKPKAYFTFEYAKTMWKKLHFIVHIAQTIPVTHFTDDPLELDVTKFSDLEHINFFFYDQPQLNLTYFPFIEYDDIFHSPLITNYDREIDLTFGCSAVTNDLEYRYKIIGEFLDLEEEFKKNGIVYNYFFKDKSRGIENFVSKDIYDDLINKSKYTCIIPSYDKNEFSLIRYFESIRSGCVPLIHEDCVTTTAFAELSELKSLNVFYNKDTLLDQIKNINYKDLIQKMVATQDFQKFRDPKFYKGYIKKYKKYF